MFERRRVMSALQDATWAPSIHNSQPWRMRIVGNDIEVVLDATQTPRLVDPLGRWALQSIGALVAGLEVAIAARVGLGTQTTFFPDGDHPAPGPAAGGQGFDGRTLAIVRPVAASPEMVANRERLAQVLAIRRTIREPLLAGGPTEPEWRYLSEQSSVLPPVRGLRVSRDLGRRLLELTAQADARQVSDPAYLAEVAGWVDREDGAGIPRGAGGAAGGTYPGRDFSRSLSGRAPWAKEATFEAEPALFAIVGGQDRPYDWLLGGYGLHLAMLAATVVGLGAGVLGQALEQPDSHDAVNDAVAQELGEEAVVHQILRLGHPEGEVTPVRSQRRPLKQVLLD